MLGLIGKKLGQTRVYDDTGAVVCVTVVDAGPNRVVQCKTEETDGYSAVQLGYGDKKENRVTKPLVGHFKKHEVAPVYKLKEFRDFPLEVKAGDEIGATVFEPGDHVDAVGLTKGRGFQGVVKRWNFGGGPRSHGQKGWFRRPGAVAAGSTPGWVDKGKKLPGQMGQKSRTVQSLRVVQVREEDNLLLIEGAIPGAKGDYVIIREAVKKPKAAKK
ncbi:MAG: 50S ribosomal protein L3 [Verrucomicrobiales bacterium]|nr:50S ribosomal protein L3 [Verrucomicrobiales bacterium]|tara:strand:- start:20367 stop:21011 length:645 start_codon:yes stop_codon:yes gene_type:complete